MGQANSKGSPVTGKVFVVKKLFFLKGSRDSDARAIKDTGSAIEQKQQQAAKPGTASPTAPAAVETITTTTTTHGVGMRDTTDTDVDATDCFTIIPHEARTDLGLPHDVHLNGPPLPPCMAERNATYNFLAGLQPPSDTELDNILTLICRVMEAPAAFLALFDDTHIFCRNAHGVQKGDFPWRFSLCAWTMQRDHPQTLVVENLENDVRFRDNEGARSWKVKFYVGAPLVAFNGHRIGSLCFVDSKPRKMDAYRCQILNNFSELVVRELEKDMALQVKQREIERLQEVYGQLQRGINCFTSPVLFVSTKGAQWTIMHCNEAWLELTGLTREDTAAQTVQQLFGAAVPGAPLAWEKLQDEAATGREFTVDAVKITSGRCSEARTLLFRPAGKDTVDPESIPIGVPSFLRPEALPEQQLFYFVTVQPQRPPAPLTRTLSPTTSGSNLLSTSIPSNLSNRSKAVSSLDALEVSTLLGCGAQGRVYFGRWYGVDVAVKVIENTPPKPNSGPGGAPAKKVVAAPVDALEAVLSQDLAHPNVVRTLSYCTIPTGGKEEEQCEDSAMGMHEEGAPKQAATEEDGEEAAKAPPPFTSETWIVMEFCDRGTLLDAVDKGWLRTEPQRQSPADLDAVLATAAEVASAMAYLHDRGIIHGDLTANNVMLASSGAQVDTAQRGFVAKVSDFGLSRNMDVQSRIKTNSYGTVTHMPPELLQHGILTKATDVYAFGVMLWEMWTGSRPWPGLSHGQVIQLVSMEAATLRLPAGTPLAIEALVTECMAYRADDRPTFHEVVARLQDLRGPQPDHSLAPPPPVGGPHLTSASGFEDL